MAPLKLHEVALLLQKGPTASEIESVVDFVQSITRSKRRSNVHTTLENCLYRILDFCTMRDVLLFSQLSRSFQLGVRDYLSKRLHSMLRPWMKDAVAFRKAMGETDTLISGSWALAFLMGLADPVRWEAKDLDLYVPRGDPCKKLVDHLSEHQGFTDVERYVLVGALQDVSLPSTPTVPAPPVEGREDAQQGYSFNRRGILNVYKLTKTFDTGKTCTIDIIESVTDNAVSPIVSFDYTCLMNYITHDGIYCLYPKLTFDKLGMDQSYEGSGHRSTTRHEKYTERGFKHVRKTTDLPGRVPCGSACPHLVRRNHDAGTMIVPLTEEPAMIKDSMRASWRLRGDPDELTVQCFNPHCPREYETGFSLFNLDLQS